MYLDATLANTLEDVGQAAAKVEREGLGAVWVGETNGDPFLRILMAAASTQRVSVGTSVAIAFARTPMTTAYTAFDLARASNGRFVLGLGSQVKTHIERRFSMPWSHSTARMREYVSALRAIWSSWQDRTPLSFRGDFYTHTVMPPFFAQPPLDTALPPIYLAGVGERMTEVAGEVADGFFIHPFTTVEYVEQVTKAALARGRARGARGGLDDLALVVPALAAVGRDEAELARAIEGTKRQLAFYASTPDYRAVLDQHGWGDLQPTLTELSKRGRWKEMGEEISDEMLHTFAVVGDVDVAARSLTERWQGVVSRISIYMPYRTQSAMVDELNAGVRDRLAVVASPTDGA